MYDLRKNSFWSFGDGFPANFYVNINKRYCSPIRYIPSVFVFLFNKCNGSSLFRNWTTLRGRNSNLSSPPSDYLQLNVPKGLVKFNC